MASYRDEAFEAFYKDLEYSEGADPRVVLRKAWDAGRRYESDRIRVLVTASDQEIPPRAAGPRTYINGPSSSPDRRDALDMG